MIAVNRNRIRSLFIFLINQVIKNVCPKMSEICPNFCIRSFFLYITTKSDLTFLKQKIRASCMPFRLAHQGTFLLCSRKYAPGVSEQTLPRKHLYTVVRISCGSRETAVGFH